MFKRKISLLLILTMLLSALCLTGCGETENTSDLEDFTVVLDWYPNAIHCFIYNAIEKGYFAEEGLNVKIQFPSDTSDGLSMTAANNADVGIYYMHYIIEAKANQNVPIKSIGAIVQEPLAIVLSLAEKNITSPEDLIGKRIGATGSELNELTVKTMVEHVGASVDDLDIVNVGFDLMSSMTSGNVDATLGCMINHEVPQMEKNGFELNYFNPTDFGIPNNYELLFVTGEKQLESKSKQLEGFLRACKKGFADMKNKPEESLEIMLNKQNAENFPLDAEVERKSLEVLLPAMEKSDASFLTQTKEMWQMNIDWLYDTGFINQKISADEVFVNLIK